MSKPNTAETAVLKLILTAAAWANIADNAASGPLTNLYWSLHTADPGEAGNQSTNEISYTGYARVAAARSTGTWGTITNGVATLQVNIDFGEMTAGVGGTVTHIGLGVGSSGATELLYSGPASPNVTIAAGLTPRVKGVPAGSPTTITED